MKERLEFEIICEDLSSTAGRLMFNSVVFIDHINKQGIKEDQLSVNAPFDLIDQLQGSMGIDPDFAPYERTELVNNLASIERLELCCGELIDQIRSEISLMDNDPEYFTSDEDEEDEL